MRRNVDAADKFVKTPASHLIKQTDKMMIKCDSIVFSHKLGTFCNRWDGRKLAAVSRW